MDDASCMLSLVENTTGYYCVSTEHSLVDAEAADPTFQRKAERGDGYASVRILIFEAQTQLELNSCDGNACMASNRRRAGTPNR